MQFPYLFAVLLFYLKYFGNFKCNNYVQATGSCTQENSAECWDDNRKKPELVSVNYGKVSRHALTSIEKAKLTYKPCTPEEPNDSKCKCHQKVWQKDLEIFKTKGISKQMLQKAAQHGTVYKILSHKLYREANCFFPSRCEGIEYFLLKLLPSLPDMDFVVNTRDYPFISARSEKNIVPLFSFSKTLDYKDIMYPAWTFWAGGPAIKLFPTGLGRWDLQREKISKAAEDFPWHLKSSKVFFRGSRTSHERDSLIYLSRMQPELVDAMYTKNQAWKSEKDTLGAEPAEEVSLDHHCRYKYLFNFRGVAASFRFKHLFLCKSLVFHVGDEWLEFFYPALKPWVHYVPVEKNPTQDEIKDILEFFKSHDSLAQEIANAGFEFIWNHLRMEDVECYWSDLLTNYSKLLKYQVEEDKTLIEIKDKSGQKIKHREEF